MMKFPIRNILLAAAGFINSNVLAALSQGGEFDYLANFDSMQAASYSVIEDENKLPSNLISKCKDNSKAPIRDAVVQSESGYVDSSTVFQQCGDDSICTIPPGTTFLVNTSINLGALVVRGIVEWNDTTQRDASVFICAGYVAVEGNGQWNMDLQVKQAFVYIKDNGATHRHLRSRAFGSAAMSTGDYPIIDITGRKLVRTWSLLAEPLMKGQDMVKLMHNPKLMGWRIGDRIAITPTEKRATGTGEDFNVIDINEAGALQLDKSAQYDHGSKFIPGSSSPALLSSEVINLSRNIVITGDDFKHVSCDANLPEAVPGEQTSVDGCRCASFRSKCTLGLHSAVMHGGEARISNIRIERCGQRGIEGKYCLHFHKLHDCPTCLFRNNAIENSHQRGIIVHSTHSSQVEQNVLYNVRGAGIYIEDGNEMHNDIKYNVVICPFPFGDHNLHGCTVPGTSNRIADTSDNQSGIYSRASTNNLVGNRVSNSFNGMLLDAGSIGRGESYGKVCEADALLGRIEGNTFHGNGRFGTYTLGGNYAKQTDQSIITDGLNIDSSLCRGFNAQGYTRGKAGAIVENVDYDNAFVGHYEAGEIQYIGHHSYGNNELLYWKETKNFDNGCSSHVTGGSYALGNLALPDQSTFIIESTSFGDGVSLEANHHCNVGVTGVLCFPQYIFHNISWKNSDKSKKWLWFQASSNSYDAADQKHGGVFSMSPPNAEAVMNGAVLNNAIFPPGYVSLVSNRFTYLLDLPNDTCVLSTNISPSAGLLYSDGILCKLPLRALKIYTRGLLSSSAPKLLVEMWYDKGGVESQVAAPDASQLVGFHQVGPSRKQGFSFPIIPGANHSYRVSISAANARISSDLVVEFSDPVLGNRFDSIEYTNLSLNGQLCGTNGLVSSHHDRRFMWSGDEFMSEEAWGNTGACAAGSPRNSPKVDCGAIKNGVLSALECPELCNNLCNEKSAYCDCGSATCKCKPGFYGDNCLQDSCSAAGCKHGKCAAKFLGGELPVTTNACICDEGWAGDMCQYNPCQTLGKTCSGHGTCVATSNTEAKCVCDNGFTGQDCQDSCDGVCRGNYPFGCATSLSGIVKYGCHPSGGCNYLKAGGEYPYSGFCTYKEISIEPTGSGPSSPSTVRPTSFPVSASPTAPLPAARCDGVCIGTYPYGCATNLVGVVKYGCHPSGGCNYLWAGGEYPYAGFCTYKEVVTSTTQPMSPQPSTAQPTSTYCGCPLCTKTKWNTLAINGNEAYTCGARITFLQSPDGGSFSEIDACKRVAGTEFPNVCGPECDPDKCSTTQPVSSRPSTLQPVTSKPTSRPSSVPPSPTASQPSTYCGCPLCTTTKWNTLAINGNDAYTCGARITFLQSPNGGSFSEIDACKRVAGTEFPNVCGPECDPDKCSTTQPVSSRPSTLQPVTSKPTSWPSSAPPSPTATLKPTFKPTTLMPTFKPTAPKTTATKSLRMVQLFSETNGLYITAYWPDGALRVDSVAYSHASTFEVHVVEGRSDQWQLRAVKNNKYVAAANGGGSFCTADRDIASGWETFTVTQLPNNKVQLKTFDGHYLGIDGTSTGPLIASATQARSWETFTVVEVPQRRGVNAGSWFVPEKWMFGSDSDLFAGVSSNVKDLYTLSKELGPVEISRRMKQHWSTWFTEADFSNMASQGINHVRIPVGYWDIVETAPYAFGGAEYIDQAIKWAAAHGISVSIDLHGAPGSQNGADHSGQEGAINWDKSPENVKLTVKVLGMICGRWGANPTVWGIEMLNEPHWSISHDLLTQFYRDGYAAIREYSDTVHVVMNSWIGPHDWTALVLPEPQYRNVVLDLHLYTPWSGFTTEQQYMDAAANWAREIRSLTPFYPIVVGEMSLATRLSSYSPQQRQSFANISMTSFVENAYGFVFWSYKLGYDSPDWAFRNALYYVKDYYLPASVNNYCGCNSCTRPVWDTIVTDAGGSFSCGSRITWLQTAQGYSEASACQRVASEFPSVCLCDTMSCTTKNPTTSMPTTAKPVTNKPITSKPTFKPTTPKPTAKTYCGCSTCTETVWNTLATDGGGSYTCGARITWLQSLAGGSLSEYNACKKVAGFEFPNGPCGPVCDPSKC